MKNSPDGKWATDLYRLTVTENPYLRRFPASPAQFRFLTWPAKEILFGGAAGGGKSVALLMGALQFVTVPGYAALLLRRTFADLNLPKALIPLSHELLAETDAAWDGQKYRWTFPNGATLSFGYLDTEADKYRYQGAAFQYCGFDELVQFSESQYRYLYSRLRKTTDIAVPLRMRAASNPGGAGHDWVRARFVDPATRGPRVFFPARLDDNPYLDRESYEESLAQLDPTTRKQLRDGNWDVRAEAGVFKAEWFREWRKTGDGELYLLGKDRRPVRAADCSRFAVADVAGTERAKGSDPDYTAIFVIDVTPAYEMVVVHGWRGQLQIPDVEDKLISLCRQHEAEYAVVEKNGLGLGVVQSARRRGLTVKAVVARRGMDKLARSQTAQIRMEAGTVFFPVGQSWVEEVIAEATAFPSEGVHDDQVDALSWACIHVQKMGGAVCTAEDDEYLAGAEARYETAAVPDAPPEPAYAHADPQLVAWLNGE